jgi:hypothetical protein
MSDKLLIDYNPTTDYTQTPYNVVGASTNLTLRTVTAHTDSDCKYVRKFGDAWLIKSVSAIADPVDVDMTYGVYALDGTLLGSRVGGGAFVAGATLATAQASYIKVTATGNCTVTATIAVTSDVEALTFVTPAEVLTNGMTINLYLSSTTSTYYDSALMYGGARHTPDGTDGLPYFTIQAGLTACDSYFPTCTVLDSAIYDEELTFDGGWTLQSALGQTPTITSGIGARTTREQSAQFNNINSSFFNATGSDTTGTGTWQNPWATFVYAMATSSKTYCIYGGSGASIMTENFLSTITKTINIETEYDKTLTIVSSNNATTTGIILTGNCVGITIKDICNSAYLLLIAGNNNVYDCTFWGGYSHVNLNGNSNVKRNIFNYSMGTASVMNDESKTAIIDKNIFISCYAGIFNYGLHSDTYTNNIFISCSYAGIWMTSQSVITNNNIIKNNVFYNCGNGIYVNQISSTLTISWTTQKNIFYGCTSGITIDKNATITHCDFYGNTAKYDGAGAMTSTSEITIDPLFIDSANNNFALKVTSPCYKTDGAEGDVGAIFGNVLVSASDVIINGFIIDGQEQYFNAIYKTGGTDYTGLLVKWCTIYDFNGTAIDDYSGSATTGTIQNCIIHDNGNGINLPWGATTIQQNIIYNNIVYGLYRNKQLGGNDHNVFFGNGTTGYYLPVTATGELITNSIFYANGAYGINSLVAIIVQNSCINDFVSTLVDYLTTGSGNITDNPLFVNENEGTEDFHIKTIARGYMFNSPCLNLADDGYSMGAYLETEEITGGGWKSYQLEHEPAKLNIESALIAGTSSISNYGSLFLRGRNYKMIFPLQWDTNTATTAKQGKKIRYFQSRIPTTKNELTRDECLFRIWFLPDTSLRTGTGSIVGSTFKITDSTADWVENEWVGFWVGVKHLEILSGTISATNKTLTKSGSGWTTDQWAGYYYRTAQRTYLILSNNANVLQLSDPNGYLTAGTADGFIEDYYKVTSNTETELTVFDTYSTIPTGSYQYYIAFVRVFVSSNSYNYQQPNYSIANFDWNAGYKITFEEE